MADCVGVDLTKATTKACAACGATFQDTSPCKNARFCDRRCWRRAKARRAAGKSERDTEQVSACIVCSVSLEGRKHGARCCSDACYQRAKARTRRGQPVQDPTEIIRCVNCGEETPRQGRRRIRFCSKRCGERYWGRQAYKRKYPPLLRKCLACAADIPTAANRARKYCNKKCAGRNRSPEVVFRYVHARRARLVGATASPLPKKMLARLRNASCTYCGGPGGTVDHVIPLSRGGHHAEGNLAPACGPCNSSKRDKLLIEWRLIKSA